MPETTVINLRDKPAPGYVRIDRLTKWGNPFVIGPDGDRAAVISKYEERLADQVATGALSVDALLELAGRRLACWCSPEPCHGDVLRVWADDFAEAVGANG